MPLKNDLEELHKVKEILLHAYELTLDSIFVSEITNKVNIDVEAESSEYSVKILITNIKENARY